jgi:FNIP Repeat
MGNYLQKMKYCLPGNKKTVRVNSMSEFLDFFHKWMRKGKICDILIIGENIYGDLYGPVDEYNSWFSFWQNLDEFRPVDEVKQIRQTEILYGRCISEYLSMMEGLISIQFDDISPFNYPFTRLPSTLVHLKLGNLFNQPLKSLPYGLKCLEFSIQSEFNQSVDQLPSTLTHLTLGKLFNQPVNRLPANLTYLMIENFCFRQSLNELPHSLNHFKLSHIY